MIFSKLMRASLLPAAFDFKERRSSFTGSCPFAFLKKTIFRKMKKRNVANILAVTVSVVLTLVLAFVFLHEQFTMKSFVGAALITAGTLAMVL